jgi:hypothetical protein
MTNSNGTDRQPDSDMTRHLGRIHYREAVAAAAVTAYDDPSPAGEAALVRAIINLKDHEWQSSQQEARFAALGAMEQYQREGR